MAQEIADSKLIDTWSSDGLKVKPDISKIIEGWQLGEQPPHEYMNWLQNTFGSKLNHILKNGVSTWNNTTQYLAGSSVQHNGNVWLCKSTNTNSEPTDSNNNWSKSTSGLSQNITVNVGAGQMYTTINQALEYLSGFYPLYKKAGVTATINLKAGFVMAEQVLVSGIALGWITIVGEDAETIITHTALTTAFNGTNYPAFGVDKGGTSPIIGQLFRFNVEKVGGAKHGLMTFGAGSSADILSGAGFIGAGTNGVYAILASTINASGANCSNAGGYGIFAGSGSTISADNTNCSNAGTTGIAAGGGSTINAGNAIIQNQTTGIARVLVGNGSHIEASGINTTGGTVPVFSQAINTLTADGIIYQ